MIDPARISRIWAKCPELKVRDPEGRAMWYDPESWNETGWEMSGGIVPAHIAEVLIRDKCVWWLAEKAGAWCQTFILSANGSKHFFADMCASVDDEKSFEGYGPSPDPTEASLLAVERVLGL